nr:alpha/beta hydrolase [Rhodoferax sp.]
MRGRSACFASTNCYWIFLRGLTRERRPWGGFMGQFQYALSGRRVVALDLPGNGYLHQQCSPLRVQDLVAHCRAQLALRSIEPPYGLLAMSLGAMVAVAWADAYPQEVAANVLINTSTRPFSPFYQRLRPTNYGALLKLAMLGAAPTLVLASEQDHLVSVECSRALARHWQCPLPVHAGAGHDLPLDNGYWVAAQVQEWLMAGPGFSVT